VQMMVSLINQNDRGVPKICREMLIEGRWVDGPTLPSKHQTALPVPTRATK